MRRSEPWIRPRSSGQQAASVPVGGAPNAGQGEEVAPAGRGDEPGHRLVDEPGLDGLKLAADVALVAVEDQAQVEAPVPVDAAVVVVAAAEDPGGLGAPAPGVGQPDVG